MNIEKLQACADVLGEMIVNFNAMPAERSKAAQAALMMSLAQSHVKEYARHLAAGMEPFDAMELIVRGDGAIGVDESKTHVLRVLTAKPQK